MPRAVEMWQVQGKLSSEGEHSHRGPKGRMESPFLLALISEWRGVYDYGEQVLVHNPC